MFYVVKEALKWLKIMNTTYLGSLEKIPCKFSSSIPSPHGKIVCSQLAMEHPSKTDATSSRKKAHFLRLSDELLLEIISQLRYDVYNNRYRQTLRSLALVCRRFHGLAIGHIFEEVSIVSDSQRFSKFRDAIKSNDSLGSLVQRLDIKWSMEMKPERSPQDLMCELPRLQYISVEAWYQSGFNASLFLRPSSPSCFYRLDLTLKSPTASDISDLSLLDGVNGLVLSVLYTFNLPQLERSEAPHTAMLQSFQAKHHTMITLASLQNLLTYPKSLNSLSIWIPGACDESVAAGYDLFTMFDTLSPRSIQQTLSSCAGSLTSLEIQGFLQTFPDHDGTRLSLARFNSLKKAKIASILFSESPIPPIDLYTLLPPSLSDFTVSMSPSIFLSFSIPPSISSYCNCSVQTYVSYSLLR